ncbi:hypothetical protein [Streptomyces sp. NPDC102462]|uniref:hypothetical protein n=1 Tax=Streptomyces sp. NPDC102462 TaxID=3366178 RepID=UPI0038046525
MRQIHQLIDKPADHPDTTSAQPLEPPAAVIVQTPEASAQVAQSTPRGGRPPSATVEELAEIARIAAVETGKLTRAIVQKAVKAKGLTISGQRLTEVMDIVRPEIEGHADSGPDSG